MSRGKRIVEAPPSDRKGVSFFCPGCNGRHVVWTAGSSPVWSWNGSYELPTFSPSILIRYGHHADGTPEEKCHICKRGGSLCCRVCHSFVTDGRIQFLGDCTHALAGRTVDLPEIEQAA